MSDAALAPPVALKRSVHTGAELRKRSNLPSFVPIGARVIHAKLSPKRFNSATLPGARGLEEKLHWRDTTRRLKSAAELLRRDFFWHVSLNPRASERQRWRRRKMLRGLSVFMRRRAAARCMAAPVYWKWHWVDNLSCYQASWEEVGEWGALIHQVIFPPIFRGIISVITHQSRDHNDEIFILAGKFLPDYI